MITLKQIRADLREIRFYYINKKKMDEAFQTTGRNEIMNLVEKYHKVMQTAPIKLYDLYVGLYIKGYTQEAYSIAVNYTPEYIQMLHKQLLQFLQSNIEE